jgi:hypothetical protein
MSASSNFGISSIGKCGNNIKTEVRSQRSIQCKSKGVGISSLSASLTLPCRGLGFDELNFGRGRSRGRRQLCVVGTTVVSQNCQSSNNWVRTLKTRCRGLERMV